MKMFVAGVKLLSGKSKKTGEQFSMPRLFGLVPVETVNNQSVQIKGHGFEPMEIELDEEAIAQFAQYKFPVVLDLETDVAPSMGEFKTIVVGVKKETPAVKAA
jgi:hypothetical protein